MNVSNSFVAQYPPVNYPPNPSQNSSSSSGSSEKLAAVESVLEAISNPDRKISGPAFVELISQLVSKKYVDEFVSPKSFSKLLSMLKAAPENKTDQIAIENDVLSVLLKIFQQGVIYAQMAITIGISAHILRIFFDREKDGKGKNVECAELVLRLSKVRNLPSVAVYKRYINERITEALVTLAERDLLQRGNGSSSSSSFSEADAYVALDAVFYLCRAGKNFGNKESGGKNIFTKQLLDNGTVSFLLSLLTSSSSSSSSLNVVIADVERHMSALALIYLYIGDFPLQKEVEQAVFPVFKEMVHTNDSFILMNCVHVFRFIGKEKEFQTFVMKEKILGDFVHLFTHPEEHATVERPDVTVDFEYVRVMVMKGLSDFDIYNDPAVIDAYVSGHWLEAAVRLLPVPPSRSPVEYHQGDFFTGLMAGFANFSEFAPFRKCLVPTEATRVLMAELERYFPQKVKGGASVSADGSEKYTIPPKALGWALDMFINLVHDEPSTIDTLVAQGVIPFSIHILRVLPTDVTGVVGKRKKKTAERGSGSGGGDGSESSGRDGSGGGDGEKTNDIAVVYKKALLVLAECLEHNPSERGLPCRLRTVCEDAGLTSVLQTLWHEWMLDGFFAMGLAAMADNKREILVGHIVRVIATYHKSLSLLPAFSGVFELLPRFLASEEPGMQLLAMISIRALTQNTENKLKCMNYSIIKGLILLIDLEYSFLKNALEALLCIYSEEGKEETGVIAQNRLVFDARDRTALRAVTGGENKELANMARLILELKRADPEASHSDSASGCCIIL